MMYLDNDNKAVSQVVMQRLHDGLWYVNNPILVPQPSHQNPYDSIAVLPDNHKAQQSIISDDASIGSLEDNNTDQDSQCTTEPTPLFPNQWDNTPNQEIHPTPMITLDKSAAAPTITNTTTSK
jgi:hypothetical protein